MARPKDPNAKSELLSAAAQVFVHKGVEQARIEDITALAGRRFELAQVHGHHDGARALVADGRLERGKASRNEDPRSTVRAGHHLQ